MTPHMGLVEDHQDIPSPGTSSQTETLAPPENSVAGPRGVWQRALSLEQHTVIVSLAFLGLFAANFLPPTDPDFWWHLRTGELIAQTGAIPTHDVFSYTAFGQPWMIPEWLAELVMYWLYAVGGYAVVVAAFSLVVTGAYFVLYRLLLRLEIDRTVALALVALAAMIRWAQWAPRPQLITFLFFSIALYLLFTFKQHGRARLWLLPLLTVVWVNVHGGYVIGIVLIGLFVVGETFNLLTHRPAARIRPLIFTGLASGVAALANPSGYAALLYPFKYATTSNNASMHYIIEWQSPDFHSYFYLPFAFAIVLFMIIGARDRLDFTHALVVLVFTVMALQSQRQIVLFALATTPILGLRLKGWGIRLAVEVQRGGRLFAVVNLALLVIVPVFIVYALATSPYSQARATPSTATYPAGGVAYLREHHLPGNLFNAYGWGGYLIYELYPEYRVFIDGRSDFYGDALVEEYARVANISPQWREVLQKYQVETVLIEKDSPLAVLLASQPDWKKVYEGDVAQIFVRQDAP